MTSTTTTAPCHRVYARKALQDVPRTGGLHGEIRQREEHHNGHGQPLQSPASRLPADELGSGGVPLLLSQAPDPSPHDIEHDRHEGRSEGHDSVLSEAVPVCGIREPEKEEGREIGGRHGEEEQDRPERTAGNEVFLSPSLFASLFAREKAKAK